MRGVGRVILDDGTMVDLIVEMISIIPPESRRLEIDGRRSHQHAFLESSSGLRYEMKGEVCHFYKPAWTY